MTLGAGGRYSIQWEASINNRVVGKGWDTGSAAR